MTSLLVGVASAVVCTGAVCHRSTRGDPGFDGASRLAGWHRRASNKRLTSELLSHLCPTFTSEREQQVEQVHPALLHEQGSGMASSKPLYLVTTTRPTPELCTKRLSTLEEVLLKITPTANMSKVDYLLKPSSDHYYKEKEFSRNTRPEGWIAVIKGRLQSTISENLA